MSLGALIILAIACSSVYDAWRSYRYAVAATEQAWLLRMDGKAADAKALLDKRAADGVRLPAWGR